MTLPEIKSINVNTIFGETITAKILPMSIKAQTFVENEISKIKADYYNNRESKLDMSRSKLKMQIRDLDELQNAYVEAKITTDLSKAGEEITTKRIAAQKEKRFDKLLENKNVDSLLDELANLTVDLDEKRELLNKSLSATLWYILRNAENLRENAFVSIDDLEESLTSEDMITIFTDNNKSIKTDEELKN